MGQYTSTTVLNARIAVSYYDLSNTDLKLWWDDGRGGGTAGDGIANGTEVRTIDNGGLVGSYNSITTLNGQLAVSYYDATNLDLKLWWDDGRGGGTAGDGLANGTELRTIDSTGITGQYTSITSLNGQLAIGYYDVTNANLMLWWDDGSGGGTAGDGLANGTEIRTLDSTGVVGQFLSLASVGGRLAIAYYDSTNGDLKLWFDDGYGGGTAGDGIANGTEARTIDSVGTVGQFAAVTGVSGRLAVAYYDISNLDLKLWYDDGRGGGIMGDGLANGSEIRTLDSAGITGEYNAITTLANLLAVSFYDLTNGDLKVWWDDGSGGGTAGDGVVNGTEVRTVDSTGDVGLYTSIVQYNNGTLLREAVAYYDQTNFDLKLSLGEVMSLNAPLGGQYTSITSATNDLAVSYYDLFNGDLKLWWDDGRGGGIAGDGIVNGTEERTLDSTGDVGQYTSIVSISDRLAIAYYDATELDCKFWWDDGRGGGTAGDGLANGTEIRTLDSTGDVGQYASLIAISGSEFNVVYYDASNGDLKLWRDDGRGGGTAGDGVANGTEIRTLDSTGDVGRFPSTAVLNGWLAVAYYDVTNRDLKFWWDDGRGGGTAGDGLANGTEIRTQDSTGDVGQYTAIAVLDGQFNVLYYDVTNGDLKLWRDDGRGGGTAEDGVANGTEIRTLDATGDVGRFPSAFILSGRLAASYYDVTNGDLKFWWDDGSGGGTAGDGVADASEIRALDSTGDVGLYTSMTLLGGQSDTAYYDATNHALKIATVSLGSRGIDTLWSRPSRNDLDLEERFLGGSCFLSAARRSQAGRASAP